MCVRARARSQTYDILSRLFKDNLILSKKFGADFVVFENRSLCMLKSVYFSKFFYINSWVKDVSNNFMVSFGSELYEPFFGFYPGSKVVLK